MVVEQECQPIEDRNDRRLAHRLRGMHVPPAREDRQLAIDALHLERQRVVAPRQRGMHRTQPLRLIAGTAREQFETTAQSGLQLSRREHLAACRRQLDGEGHPIELDADRLDDRGGRLSELERWIHRPGPRQEQRNRVLGAERRHDDLVLTAKMQGPAARHEDRKPRRGGKELGDESGVGRHLLEVVEHEQHVAITNRLAHPLDVVSRAHVDDADRAGNGGRRQIRIVHRGQLDEPHAIGEPRSVVQLPGDFDGEPGLADPAGTEQRDQPHVWVPQQVGDAGELDASAKERRRGSRDHGHVPLHAGRIPSVVHTPTVGRAHSPAAQTRSGNCRTNTRKLTNWSAMRSARIPYGR